MRHSTQEEKDDYEAMLERKSVVLVSEEFERLKTENAKLRELLCDAAIELYVNGNSTDGATELLFDQMRELGIGVGE